jgi:hypothetical protein
MRTRFLAVLAMAACGLLVSGANLGKSESGKVLVSSSLRKAAQAGGPRFQGKGQERWAATANLKGGKGEDLVTGAGVVLEWPGRLALSTKNGKAVFDPITDKKSTVDAALAMLAELLLEDTLDGFLALHVSGAPLRIVGSGYPDPDRTGETVDVVSLAMPRRAVSKTGGGIKHYWFDRKTGRLVKVIHPGDQVMARLSNWLDVQGNPFPATITVYQNGAVSHVLTLAIAGVGPEAADGMFEGN